MLRVYTCLSQEHDFRLVLVAVAICLFSTLTAFAVAGHMRRLRARPHPLWFAALAFVTGTGIWATHFIAMLAYQPHLPTAYAPGITALSILIAIAMTGIAWWAMLKVTPLAPAVTGLIMTAGIASMHFTGMAALQTEGHLRYDLALVAGSLLIGWLCAGIAMSTFRANDGRLRSAAIPAFVAAICAIHFGSMGAASITPDPNVTIPTGAIGGGMLAFMVATLVVAVLGIALAVTILEGKLARLATEEAERLKHFTESAMEGLAILDGDRVVDANQIFWKLSGHDPANPPHDLVIGTLLPIHRARAAPAADGGFIETELTDAAGNIVCVETATRLGPTGGGRELIVVRDITERKAAAAKIAHLASHDPLTGCANRLSMSEALEEALTRSSIHSPVAMLCIDLDRFKAINDLYGHPVGDAVLIEAAQRIRDCLADGETLARLGGDEFAIIQQPGDQPRMAGHLAEQIIASITNEFVVGELTLNLGVSVGIAFHPANATTGEDLHKKADLALYRAKADGKGVFRFFDDAMDKQLVLRHQMEAELRRALPAGQLSLHYQPLVSVKSGGVFGFEALLRWHHPSLGNVPPSVFIPMAEETGLIIPIGEWVLREACREAASWQQPLQIAVNLSPVQFSYGDIAATVETIVAETGIDPSRLDLEITEGLLINDAEKALEVLRRLKALGVQISMDDFGSGYSSLSYFRVFPFDKVKIDQSFVRDMAGNPQALAIIKAVIGLGKGLGISVLAEGVETHEQMTMLQQEGCEQMQGYVISRPAPIEQFERIVLDRNNVSGDAPKVLRIR
ncbi:EAL domain-containing protein [Flavisphingomonas formosensis]|uniref:EAL domain-containing protein n=1 Tax=Flavisphingomonas formosensis TaxID=861534 RepID=UPI0012F78255|nr:EAL domain-containing protein [Sphingomonas formosensis]